MFRNLLLGLALTSAEKALHEPRDYKVAFWFEKKDPLDTFQFKIYDVTKGEYSPAVDQWLATMKTRFPNHVAYVRKYYGTSKEVADKVIAELLFIAGPNLGYGIRDTNGLGGSRGLPKLLSEPVNTLPTVGSSSMMSRPSATYLNPVSPPSPFPFPYTRPHP